MNLYTRLAQLARSQPDKAAIEGTSHSLSYRELDVAARRVAAGLRSRGVGTGDFVGLRLKDTPAHVAAFFGVMRLGAAILPFDWRGTQAEFERVKGQFGPAIILTDGGAPAGLAGAMTDLADVMQAEPDEEPVAPVENAPMGLSLTSGTTGTPKAMVVTHEQLHARCAARTITGVFRPDDRYLSTLPLAYPAGREHAICVILLGATLVIFPSLFEPGELVDHVNANGITALIMSPNSTRALLRMRPASGLLMPGLRTMISATSKLQPEERTDLLARVAPGLIDYYGSTGTGPIAAITRPADIVAPSAVGHPVFGMEVEIVDDDDTPLALGETGNIRVRGPAVSTRAIGAADEREGFRGGWYYPGDLGSLGEDGLLHLHGRAADLIKRGGLMVHAQEVEQALRRHASVQDAAVVGAPSATLGQDVVAFVMASGPVDARDLIRHCRRELAPYKVPARIEFRDALPRNASGKVVKAALLELLE
ncbi:long-chain fatty acid--CoA ligase [Aquibium carbonis]|uniref:Long-chain fatty acid--CoA ligase n=1 Tax=Aquibium carbonis TaxID=2495581 RepID=A0A429Z2L7_9HYPH|nr:class I adenylate-forming enzyme family protein [Aquibium carbonis]RST87939.1 long-chain fatty acid--CoA ligase [Aquibium carbonis]